MAAAIPPPGKLTAFRVRSLARRGETEHVEFKGHRTSLDQLVDAAVCLANGDGGLVLFGVNDDGSLEGADLRDASAVAKTVFHSTAPSQRVEVQEIVVAGHRIIGIWVQHSPVLVSTRGGAYFERWGTECIPMTPDRLIVRQINTQALDISNAVTPLGLESVDELEVERYRRLLPPDEAGERLRRQPTPELLRTIQALRPTRSGESLTVGGLLVFGREEEIKGVIPQHQFVYLRTPSGSTDYERRVVTSAPVLKLLDQIALEITVASRVRTVRLGRRDLELPDYPERVLREALVNAIAHRHYTMPGDTVIRQTNSYLEIESPGGFPEGIDADTVIQHAPVHRNRHLAEILDKVRVMERAGLGVDRIYEDQIRYGKLPPSYDGTRTAVRLRLDAREFDEPFARFVLAEEEAGRTWRVEDLLVMCQLRRMGPQDRASLARVMQRPEGDANEILAGLLGSVLDLFGAGPGTRYALAARVQAAMGTAAAYTRERGLAREAQRTLVLQHAFQFGYVDNQTVRALLQVGPAEATNLLRAMAARGQLVQVGQRRWARYRPVDQTTLSI